MSHTSLAESGTPTTAAPAREAPSRRRIALPADKNGVVTGALLLAILALAAVLRLAGPNWDSGHFQHPDERFLVMVTEALGLPRGPLAFFDTATSPLNPYNRGFDGFAYGTLPVFIVKGLS